MNKAITDTAAAAPTRWPCLDEWGRYRSFPCQECGTTSCWAGPKPIRVLPRPVLNRGEKECGVCRKPFKCYGKGKYCSDECRKKAISKQRRMRRNRVGEFIY